MTAIEIKPKNKVLKKLAVSSREVLETVGIAIGGDQVGMKRFPIIVRLGSERRDYIEEIKNLPVGLSDDNPYSESLLKMFKM